MPELVIVLLVAVAMYVSPNVKEVLCDETPSYWKQEFPQVGATGESSESLDSDARRNPLLTETP